MKPEDLINQIWDEADRQDKPVKAIAAECGLGESTMYKWRKKNPEFKSWPSLDRFLKVVENLGMEVKLVKKEKKRR